MHKAVSLVAVELEVRYRTTQEICATLGPVVIRICDRAPTEVADIDRVEQLFDELLETHKNIALLLVLTHGTALPDSVGQRRAKESMHRYADRLVGVVALLGLGFWASAVRTTLSAIIRMVRQESFALEGSVEEAIERLTMELVGLDGEALLRAYELLWAELTQLQASSSADAEP